MEKMVGKKIDFTAVLDPLQALCGFTLPNKRAKSIGLLYLRAQRKGLQMEHFCHLL